MNVRIRNNEIFKEMRELERLKSGNVISDIQKDHKRIKAGKVLNFTKKLKHLKEKLKT